MPYPKNPSNYINNQDKKKTKKSSNLGKFAKALVFGLSLSACTSDYPNNEFNFSYDSNNDRIEGYYNISFNHSEGSAWYSVDSYNINLSQTGDSYILKINDKEYRVKSPDEAKNRICEYISGKKEGYVHEESLQKADNKTADFMERYKKYANDQDRAPEKSIKLKNGKVQEESD